MRAPWRMTIAQGLDARGMEFALTFGCVCVVLGQVPFVIYYSRVGLELSKLVFQGQKMQPP